MKATLSPLLVLLSAASASAGEHCLLDGAEMFSCTVKDDKKAVAICDMVWEDGDKVSYAFFEPGQAPELAIERRKAQMAYRPWNGVGRWVSDAVTFMAADGVHAYEVWYAYDRNEGGEIDGGVNVLKNGEEIARLACDAGSVRHDLPTLIERIETAQASR